MENETIQILELFGGIGSPRCALRKRRGNCEDSQGAVEEIYTGGLAKVTLNLRGGVKASISQNSKGEINVERTETKKTETHRVMTGG